MIDLSPWVRPGVGVWWGQTSAEPTPLVHALLDQAERLGPVDAFCGMSWDERLSRELPTAIRLVSYGALGVLRSLSRHGRLEIVPCNYSALPDLFANGRLPRDVGLLQVAPPDVNGLCSLGVGVDYVADAVAHTPTLIAEINRQMPAAPGAPSIPIERFSAVVQTDRALASPPVREADHVERRIADNVAALVDNGDTIQIGVGSLPSAVLQALHGHSDLGVHSGMISDPVLRLVDLGVITGAKKEIDVGLAVTGAALGSAELYRRIPDLPVRFCAASYTHAPSVLAKLRRLVAINSAIEVDLTGQIGAEMWRGAYVGAIGGQSDFSRAASATGGRSIIALRSTSRTASTITAALRGAVTTSRSDVDHVVTEHGVATLTGVPLDKRAQQLIAIAAPEHRDNLARALRDGAPPQEERA